MKRINIHLSEKQIEKLRGLVKETGLNMAELIRRALDAYLAKQAE